MKKFNKSNNPRLSSEEKKATRQEVRNKKAASKADRKAVKQGVVVSVGNTEFIKPKPSKFDNKKPKKDKINLKLAITEFPAKLMKDVTRVKWVPKASLSKRFIAVILFLAFFAVGYEIVDQILLVLFKSINLI